jgi:hypothetical protein
MRLKRRASGRIVHAYAGAESSVWQSLRSRLGWKHAEEIRDRRPRVESGSCRSGAILLTDRSMSRRLPQSHQQLAVVEVRKLLLLHICSHYTQACLEVSERKAPLWQSSTVSLENHLEYLDDQGWIAWSGLGPPVPTMRGIYLAEAIQERQSLQQFLFSLDE